MFTLGVLMLFSGSFYLGYQLGNKYEIGLWTKDAKPKKIGGNIIESFRKLDK